MKNFFTLMFLCFLNTGWAKSYYFSAVSGDDSRTVAQAQNPSTPWKSLTKLNTVITTLLPGDSVLLKRGETFSGTIVVKKSGTSTAPIVIGAYGSGNKPIVTSLKTISGWVSKGNGIYETSSAISGTRINMVLLNGVQQEIGRYPNSNTANGGFLTFESHSGTTSIIDNELTSTINWTGADVVIRKRRWIIDRDSVTAHSGTKITFKPSASYVYAPTDKFGYFFENSLKTLDKFGEWYYNRSTQKLSVYFGSNNPSSYKVEVPVSNDLIYTEKANYVVFDNLSIKGSNLNTFNTRYGSYVSLTNCDLSFASNNGVMAFMAANFRVEGCTINNSNNDGIDLGYAGDNAIIRNNKILNTSTFAGMSGSGDGKGQAIHSNASGTTIEYNEIKKCGFTAINFGGSNTTVKNNYIDTFCYIKDDGGGIYTFGGSGTNIPTVTNRKVTGNIVMNGIGAANGAFNQYGVLVQGIYLDNGSMNVDVAGNTVFNVSDMAMLLNGVKNIKFSSNTFYAPIIRHVCFSQLANHPLIRNNSVSNNILFTRTTTEEFISRRSQTTDTDLFATISGNYYARLTDANTATLHTKIKAYDANAKFKDYSTAVRYEYNATKVAKTIALDATYVDAKNVTYSGSITLQPYTSAVLIRTGAITNVAPTVSITSPATKTTFAAPASVTINATAADVNGTVKKVSFYNGTTLLGTDSTSPYSFTWKNVAAGNYTITAKATDNGSLVTTSAPVAITVSAPNVAPTVSIISPVANTSLAASASVIISAAAVDIDGTVSKVDFYNNDTLIGTATTSPYTFTWSNVPAGNYTIKAKATDNDLAVTASAAIAISVFTPDVTSINVTSDTLSSTSDTLSAIADAYVRTGNYASVNYGNDTSLTMKSSTVSGYSRSSYLKFSLNSLVNINSAKIRIYGRNTGTSNITISTYGLDDDSWNENSITFNNAPTSNLPFLSSTSVNNEAKYYEFDVTDFVKKQFTGDKVVSFLIKDPANQNNYLFFNSKENSQNPPQLIVEIPADSLSLDTKTNPESNSLTSQTLNTLSSIADAYVRTGSYASVNYGNDTSLTMKSSTVSGYSRSSYLKFSLNSLVNINSAKIRIYGRNTGTSNITISTYGLDDDSWNENSITFNNAPISNLPFLSSTSVNNEAKYYEFDVTDFVKKQFTGDKVVSFLIKDPANQNNYLVFNSKENSQNPPQLIFEIPADSLAVDTAVVAKRDTLVNNANIDSSTLQLNSSEDKDTTSLLNVRATQLRQNFSRVEDRAYSVKVFPNPAVNKIQITVGGPQITNQKAQLSIINSSGILIKTMNVNLGNTIEADVSSLSAGIYIATLKEGNNIISQKFLKN